MNICVYGAASDNLKKKYIEAGEELGRLLAERGHKLVYGGGSTGMMGAVSRGAEAGKAHITCVIPKFFTDDSILKLDCDTVIRTEGMRDRKQLLEELSDAFIVTPGAAGTFDEFFEIMTLRQLDRHNKPITILNTAGYYDKMFEMIEHAIAEGALKEKCKKIFPAFDTPEQVLDYIENYTPEKLEGLR